MFSKAVVPRVMKCFICFVESESLCKEISDKGLTLYRTMPTFKVGSPPPIQQRSFLKSCGESTKCW